MKKKLIIGLSIGAITATIGGAFTGGLVFSHQMAKENTAYAVTEKQKEIDEINESLGNLEIVINEKEKEVLVLKKNKQSLEIEKAEIQRALSEKENQLSQLEEDKNVLEEEKQSIQTQLENKEKEIQDLNILLSNKENELETIQSNFDSLNTQFEALQETYNALLITSNKDKEDIQKLNSDITTLNNEVSRLTNAVESARNEGHQQGMQDAFLQDKETVTLGFLNGVIGKDIRGEISSINLNDSCSIFSCNTDEIQGFYLLKDNYFGKVYETGFNWSCSIKLTETKFLISSQDSDGMLLLNLDDFSVTESYESGQMWDKGYKVQDGVYIISSNSNVTKGLLVYKEEGNDASKVNCDGYAWDVINVYGNEVILSSPATTGLFKLNLTDLTITKIYNSGKAWECISEEEKLFASKNSSAGGILQLSDDISSVVQVYSVGNGWEICCVLPNKNILISSTISSGSGNQGILMFDVSNNTCTKIYASGYKWLNSKTLSTGELFIFGGGLLKYNIETGNFSSIMTRNVMYVHEMPNKKVLLSGSYEGIYIYDLETSQILNMGYASYNDGYKWDTVEIDELGATLSSTSYPKQGKLRYTFETGKFTKVVEG